MDSLQHHPPTTHPPNNAFRMVIQGAQEQQHDNAQHAHEEHPLFALNGHKYWTPPIKHQHRHSDPPSSQQPSPTTPTDLATRLSQLTSHWSQDMHETLFAIKSIIDVTKARMNIASSIYMSNTTTPSNTTTELPKLSPLASDISTMGVNPFEMHLNYTLFLEGLTSGLDNLEFLAQQMAGMHEFASKALKNMDNSSLVEKKAMRELETEMEGLALKDSMNVTAEPDIIEPLAKKDSANTELLSLPKDTSTQSVNSVNTARGSIASSFPFISASINPHERASSSSSSSSVSTSTSTTSTSTTSTKPKSTTSFRDKKPTATIPLLATTLDSSSSLDLSGTPSPWHAVQRNIFDPVDLIESIGELMVNVAERKGLELILQTPVEKGKESRLWVIWDRGCLRQLLFMVLHRAIRFSRQGTAIEFNIRRDPPRPSNQIDILTNKPKFFMKVTIETIFLITNNHHLEKLKSDKFINDLVRIQNGSLRVTTSFKNDGFCSLELEFDMETTRGRSSLRDSASPHSDRDELGSVMQISNPYDPVNTDDLLSYASLLAEYPVILIGNVHTQFIQNLVQYFENWGMDITYDIPTDMTKLPQTIESISQRPSTASAVNLILGVSNHASEFMTQTRLYEYRQRQCLKGMILIDDDFGMLDAVLHDLINRPNQIIGVFYFTTPSNFARITEFIQKTINEGMMTAVLRGRGRNSSNGRVSRQVLKAMEVLVQRVLVCCKPVGRRKILSAIRGVMLGYALHVAKRFGSGSGSSSSGGDVGEEGVSVGGESTGEDVSGLLLLEEELSGDGSDIVSKSDNEEILEHVLKDVENISSGEPISEGTTIPETVEGVSALLRKKSHRRTKHSPSSPLTSTTKSSSAAIPTDQEPKISTPIDSTKEISPNLTTPSKPIPQPLPKTSSPPTTTPTNPTPISPPKPAPKPPTTTTTTTHKKDDPTPTHSPTESTSITPPINVLIAEDNPINQKILSTLLKKSGIHVTVASNGLEAVQKWQSGRFHLVIMDIIMPLMDGIQATQEIRRLERLKRQEAQQSLSTKLPSSDVVIVALTASSLPADRDSALAAGCNDYLIKPVSLVWLQKKVMEWGSMQALIDHEQLSLGTPDSTGSGKRL